MKPRFFVEDVRDCGYPPDESWAVGDREAVDEDSGNEGWLEFFPSRRQAQGFARTANARGYEAARQERWRYR